jgi:hypothetical protein
MDSTIDTRLDRMARSLQEHIDLAKELKLTFVAQLLTMTAMEIRINQHRISPQEMDTLCECADAQSPAHEVREVEGVKETARVINFPGRGRCS